MFVTLDEYFLSSTTFVHIFNTSVSNFATERLRKTTEMTQTASLCVSSSLNMFVRR